MEESPTKFTVTTTDPAEASILANARKLVFALSNIMDWQRRMYNGKDYGDGTYILEGDENSVIRVIGRASAVDHGSANTDGIDWEKVKKYYSEDEVQTKLDGYLEEVRSIVNDFMY